TDQNNILVQVPSIESIAGDKLTAFAPTTTGIPYGKGKEVEIIKQLHDVGRLYDGIDSVAVVAAAFNHVVVKEIAYRGNLCTTDDVFSDIIETGLMLIKRDKNVEEPDKSRFLEIKLGLLQFKSYQTKKAFRIEDAIIAAGKAALLAARIKAGDMSALPRFDPEIGKENYLITNPAFIYLNRLPAEALFYWRQAVNSFYI
ncbi:MAG TPA: hypothetical protein VF421_04835, partial [Niabella sp.]